jgi:hypothetical protein
MRFNTDIFIQKSKNIHGNKYDYTVSNYVNSRTNVEIKCIKHGIFNICAKTHYYGGIGCPYCSGRKLHINDFINKANKIHSNKYNYDLVNYNNTNDKVDIICQTHGKFNQKINNHINGNGCPSCSSNQKSNTVEFINKAKIIHGKKYLYNKTDYKSSKIKVNIVCPKHGEFNQTPTSHLNGWGCKKCGIERSINKQIGNVEKLLSKFNKIHEYKYKYVKNTYKGYDYNMTIICPKHGEFNQTPNNHSQGKGCIKCSNSISKGEKEIKNFIKNELNIDNILSNSRKIIKPYELDIYLKDYNIAIEFCGLYWHSELFRNKNYHLNKLKKCDELGIRLITIFEDEWSEKKDVVKSIIKSICNKETNKIDNIGDINIREIPINKYIEFTNKYDLFEHVPSSIKVGLFIHNELFSIIGFSKNKDSYIITKFISKYDDINCLKKLLKYSTYRFNIKNINVSLDLRFYNIKDNIFTLNGFKLNEIVKPNNYYVKSMKKHINKNYNKNYLVNMLKSYDSNISLDNNMRINKYIKLYDCGSAIYNNTY